MQKQTGFLLSYFKYGENDAVLHCFTRENGFQAFFIRGLYASKNKKKAYLMPLHELTLTVGSNTQNASLLSVSKIEKTAAFDVEWDMKQSSVVFFVADFLHQVLKNETSNEKLYSEIDVFLQRLAAGNFQAHYTLLIQALEVFGLTPLVSEEKFLNIERGIFEEEFTPQHLEMEISELWKTILLQKSTAGIKIEASFRKKLLDSILLFYRNHFPEFYTPKSLPIIQQLFE